jgi:hypothetical protein
MSSVYWIFTKLGHMFPLWKGKNPIYFGVITIIPFDKLYRQVYFVMHTFLVSVWYVHFVNCIFTYRLHIAFPKGDLEIYKKDFLNIIVTIY